MIEKVNLVNSIKQPITGNIMDNKLKSTLQQQYEALEKAHKDYVKGISKSDFANSFTRYNIELEFLKNLKEIALKLSMPIDNLIEKEAEVRNNLKKLGYTIE